MLGTAARAGGFFLAVVFAADQLGGLFGGFLRALGQFAHFVRHHCETTPLLACARRFNGGVQRQQIGLSGNILNGGDNFAHLLEVALHLGLVLTLGLLTLRQFLAGMTDVNIGEHADHTQRHTFGIAPGASARPEPAVFAILALQAVFNIKRRAPAVVVEVGSEGVEGAFLVFGMQARSPAIEDVGKIVFVFKTEQAAELIRPPEGVVRIDRITGDDAHIPQTIVEHGGGQFKTIHEFIQFRLPLVFIVNVDQGACHAQGAPMFVAAGRPLGTEPAIFTIFQFQAVGDVVRRLPRGVFHMAGKGGQRGVQVVRMQAAGPASQYVGKIALVIKAQHMPEGVRPVKRIVVGERLAGDDNVPQPLIGSSQGEREAVVRNA